MMGSHSIAQLYERIPEAVRERLKGGPYSRPEFPDDPPDWLKGSRVAIVTTHGPELPEVHEPIEYLRARGVEVKIVTQDWLMNPASWPSTGFVVLSQWLDEEVGIKADMGATEAAKEDFDVAIIPGGAWNPDMLRTDDAVLNLLRNLHSRQALIASICHGPQVLISMGIFPRGTHITGVNSIRVDLKNAGFVVHESEPVVYDQASNILTARDPNDLGAWLVEIGRRLRLMKESRDSRPGRSQTAAGAAGLNLR